MVPEDEPARSASEPRGERSMSTSAKWRRQLTRNARRNLGPRARAWLGRDGRGGTSPYPPSPPLFSPPPPPHPPPPRSLPPWFAGREATQTKRMGSYFAQPRTSAERQRYSSHPSTPMGKRVRGPRAPEQRGRLQGTRSQDRSPRCWFCAAGEGEGFGRRAVLWPSASGNRGAGSSQGRDQ